MANIFENLNILEKRLPNYNFFFAWLAIKYLMDQLWSYILKWFSHAIGFTPIEQISWNPTHFWAVSSTKMSVCVYTSCSNTSRNAYSPQWIVNMCVNLRFQWRIRILWWWACYFWRMFFLLKSQFIKVIQFS